MLGAISRSLHGILFPLELGGLFLCPESRAAQFQGSAALHPASVSVYAREEAVS